MVVSNFGKLWLLMEKNFLLQWRHKIKTLCYILIPVIIAILSIILRSFVGNVLRSSISPPSVSVLNVAGSVFHRANEWEIAYSPNTPLLTNVVQNAVDSLMEYNNGIDIFVEFPLNILITPYANSSYLDSIYLDPDNVNRIFAGIQFDDSLIGQTALPNNLELTLRFPMRLRSVVGFQTSWHTDLTFPLAFTMGPRSSSASGASPDYAIEGFVALQHAVSMAIIETKSGSRELFDELAIDMQRFPHPEYFNDFFIVVIPMLLLFVFLIGFMFPASSIVSSIVEEKEKQLKEAMKIMGLSTWHHWTAWFLNQYILLMISVILLVILFKIPVLSKTDADGDFFESFVFLESIELSLLIVFLLLYAGALVTFSFMMSTFFDRESKVSTVSKIVWLVTFFPSMMLTIPGTAPSLGLQILVCFSFNSALTAGFEQITVFGSNSMVMTWSEMFSPLVEDRPFVFGYVMVMMLANIILYLLIALYVEKVFPGQYGVAQPWYFLFTKTFWGKSQKNTNLAQESEKHEGLISESDPVGMNVGIDIIDLTKVYNDEKVVDNLNLKMYEDQITILLGHNGAGKSTTLSMITGMISPTSGTAILGGYDISTETISARASMGLCPQHNILFSGLTVEEHLRFYCRLKGVSGTEVVEETERFIQLLDLVAKRHNVPSALSGGQKRKLSVGIALCGKSKLVFLDEPSSGLDPSARRGLWEILEKEKFGRTIIMTTHFMDEAEILGDRVAIMSAGHMKCIGSPFFLKQQYKLGYTLSIVKGANCDTLSITRLLSGYVPELKPPADIGSELAYMLPHGSSHQFEGLLGELERNQIALGFHSYGLTASALEEVFLKVGADAQSIREHVECNLVIGESHASYTTGPYTVTGNQLIINHIGATLLKRLLTTIRSWTQLIIHIGIPFLMVLANLIFNVNIAIFDTAALDAMTLNLQNGFIRTNTLMTSPSYLPESQRAIVDAYEKSFGESDSTILTNWGNVDMSAKYLREVPENMRAMRFENMIGVSFTTNAIVAWFSGFSYHDQAIALSMLDNAILRSVSPESSLTFINQPIAIPEEDTEITAVLDMAEGFQTLINSVYAVSFATSFFIMIYIKERESRSKLLQKASGLSSAVMWGCSFLYDYSMHIIISIVIIIGLVISQSPGYSTFSDVGRTFLLFLVYGFAALPIVYLMAYLFSSPSRGFVIIFFINILAGFAVIAFEMFRLLADIDNIDAIIDGIETVLYVFPFYALTAAMWNMASIHSSNAQCRTWCNNLFITECTAANLREELMPAVRCLEDIPFFGWGNPGISQALVYMIISGIILFALLMLIEYRLIPTVTCCNPPTVQRPYRFIDDDVEKEKQRVESILHAPNEVLKLISRALKRQYKNHLAVNEVTFAMNSGECFGLLGTNGAGKTSTFKMLAGDLQITAGEAWVHGYSVNKDITNVYKYIGYCPQFDALFESLTGRENLTIYCWLKGIPMSSTRIILEDLSKKLGFQKYLNKVVSKYSGGNKRKLSTAIALLGDSPVIFLDEPTTGMDPAAKRQLWEVILEQTRLGRSVVLTSHSMEECQALCSRLTIMVDGEFRCLGSPQHLKNKFSKGCTITIQLAQNDTIVRNNSNELLGELQDYLKANFGNLEVKEIAQNLISYNIQNQSVLWSKLFGILERAKDRQIIEDYSISQTTLEEVFLQFTNK